MSSNSVASLPEPCRLGATQPTPPETAPATSCRLSRAAFRPRSQQAEGEPSEKVHQRQAPIRAQALEQSAGLAHAKWSEYEQSPWKQPSLMPNASRFTKSPASPAEGQATLASMHVGQGRCSWSSSTTSSSTASMSITSTPSDDALLAPPAPSAAAAGALGVQGTATASASSVKSRYCVGSPSMATSQSLTNSPGCPVAVTTDRTKATRPFTSSEPFLRRRS
mmetsp:Transcript_58422/g.167659  ORF Transcript_58422/g.167659 Transcript_58422/m.167659 type:complete len:222 (-) Transcript_58422:2036-2701(-)